MSSSEQQSGPLAEADLYVLKVWIAQIATSFLLFGIYVTFTLIAIYSMVARNVDNKARFTLLVVTIVMLLNSTAVLILDIGYILLQIPILGFNPPNAKIMRLLPNMKIAGNFLERLNYLINDSIVVWRTWILFPHHRIVKSILAISLLACYACSIFDAASGAVNVLQNVTVNGTQKELLVLDLPLLFINGIATSLVAYKAWYHNHEIKRNLGGSGPRRNKIQKILVLLIESGAVYICFWIPVTFFGVFEGTRQMSFQVYFTSLPFISAVYPIIIILFVALENNKEEHRNGFSLSQSIRFVAEAQPHISTLGNLGDSEAVAPSFENRKQGD